MFGSVKDYFEKKKSEKKWRKQNANNFTTYGLVRKPENVEVGRGTYGNLVVYNDVDEAHLKIGNYCSIANNTIFLLGIDHNINKISSYPFMQMMIDGEYRDAVSKGDIIVEDDVWIGYGVTVLSGVHIGQGAVIAAGSVVSKDVPPYAIVGGIPAKVIKYRFAPEIIEELLKVDYSKMDEEMVRKHIKELYVELDDVSQLAWMPKKKEQ